MDDEDEGKEKRNVKIKAIKKRQNMSRTRRRTLEMVNFPGNVEQWSRMRRRWETETNKNSSRKFNTTQKINGKTNVKLRVVETCRGWWHWRWFLVNSWISHNVTVSRLNDETKQSRWQGKKKSSFWQFFITRMLEDVDLVDVFQLLNQHQSSK